MLWVVIVLAILFFLYAVRGVLLPFVIAFALSAILDPVIRKLRLRGWSRPMAVISVMTIFLGAIVAMGMWLGPIVGNQVGKLRGDVDTLATQFLTPRPQDNFFVRWNPVVRAQESESANQIDVLFDNYSGALKKAGMPASRQEFVDKFIEPHRGEIGQRVQSFFGSLLGVLGGAASQLLLMIFVPILMVLILMDMEQFKRRSATWIPPAIRAQAMSMLSDIGQVFMKYLRGVTISVLSYMVVMSLVLTVLRVPYSVLLGVIFGAVYLIPYLNGIICSLTIIIVTGLSPAKGDLFFHFDSSWNFGIMLAVVYLVCHLIFDNLVYPRLVGGSVGLHPVVSFFVILSGGALFGLVGMILAFPLAGAVKVILERLLRVTSSQADTLGLPAVPLRHRAST
ncbi:MAG: AI-2E family transporter [Fimbriimonadales bacterium]